MKKMLLLSLCVAFGAFDVAVSAPPPPPRPVLHGPVCRECNGHGHVRRWYSLGLRWCECPVCRGTGRLHAAPPPPPPPPPKMAPKGKGGPAPKMAPKGKGGPAPKMAPKGKGGPAPKGGKGGPAPRR